MMDAALADKFIKKASSYTPYNINVMNEKGIIIASSDSSRVGSFHEIAYHIMSADKEMVEVVSSDHFQGGRIGINMALLHKKEKVGVVGVSGEPEEIRDAALLIKMSLETMLEYEAQNKKHYQQQSLKTRFIDGLLYQEEADSQGELTAVSEQLGYDALLPRIPILISFDRQTDAYKLLETARGKQLFGFQDIGAVTRNNNIIIFKSLREQKELPGQYERAIQDFLERFGPIVEEWHIGCSYYVGSVQERYCYYRKGFQHCVWLKEYCRKRKEGIFFFYDYVGEYMRDMIPVIELNRIFDTLCRQLEPEMKDFIVEMVETLHRNNYNLNISSKELYIHKNTLIFRYNKIKHLFQVNPIPSMADREFLSWLALYLRKNR